MDGKVRKVIDGKWVGGVSGGIAYAIGMPTWLVRVLWVAAVVCGGFGILLYVLLWIFMPAWETTPPDYYDKCSG